VRAQNLQELVYKQGSAGITKATVSIVFHNNEPANGPSGYEDKEYITVTRQVWGRVFWVLVEQEYTTGRLPLCLWGSATSSMSSIMPPPASAVAITAFSSLACASCDGHSAVGRMQLWFTCGIDRLPAQCPIPSLYVCVRLVAV
jgi:hypothetical protein